MQKNIVYFLVLGLLNLGTTFIVKDNGIEVGRWVEQDGKDGVEIVEASKAPSSGAPAAVSRAPQRPRYEWYQDSRGYEAVMRHFKDTQEPVLLYFRASWCPVCRKYDEILAKNEVREFLAPFMKARIDIDKEKALTERFQVNAYPTFLVFADGKIKKLPLYPEPARFLDACRKAGLVQR